MKNKKDLVSGLIQLAFCLLLCLGTLFIFHSCGPKEDGTWMSCHWAQQSAAMLGGVLAVLSLLSMLAHNFNTKLGMTISMLPVTVAAMLMPGTLIHLCMMADMRCRTIMRPCVILIGVLILVITAIRAAILAKEAKKNENA